VFGHILVPIDFTDKSAKALDAAMRLAAADGSRLTLLHVIETLEYEDAELKPFYESLESSAWSKLQPMAERVAQAGIEVEQDVVYGRRAVCIVDYASDKQADLLILGSHRITPDNPRKNLVTLSYQVSIMCQCPVLLVK